jgi:hypothetical protein
MVGRPEEQETIRGDTAEKRPYQTPVHSLLHSPVSRAATTSPRWTSPRWIRRSTSEGLRHSRTFPQPHSKEFSPTYGITRVAASAPSSLNERRGRSELSLRGAQRLRARRTAQRQRPPRGHHRHAGGWRRARACVGRRPGASEEARRSRAEEGKVKRICSGRPRLQRRTRTRQQCPTPIHRARPPH